MKYTNENRAFFNDIFVVLTYKNTVDIIELLDSLKECVKNYRVIIVNSFFSEETKRIFAEIATSYDCDFIPIENKGYGFGNNVGIEYALSNYDFDRVVISNPDIVVQEYDQDYISTIGSGVFGGCITNAKGKKQNPLRVNDFRFTNNTAYYLYVRHSKLMFYLSILLSKIFRSLILHKNNGISEVFAIHGSFFTLTRDVFNKAFPLFDENIFMFQEEIDIANMFKNKRIPVYFTNKINVLHKEDGDVNASNLNNAKLMADSCRYVYNKWR